MTNTNASKPTVAYITGSYPLLTTTFIDREIRMLRSWGADIKIVALRRPTTVLSEEQQALAATVMYPRPVRPWGMVRAHLSFGLGRPIRYPSILFRLASRRGQSLKQRVRTVGHFVLAVYVAAELRSQEVDRLHAHFIDRSAIVAHIASRLLDVPYSITAHASDIYVNPVLLDAKVEGAEFVATCTGYNRDHLVSEVKGAKDKVELLYHGLEFDNYEPRPFVVPDVPRLIAVGQLREKKGYLYLLDACHRLVQQGLVFRCQIIGEGPQRGELESRIAELGLAETVTLSGALPHDQVIDAYNNAHAFVLPCVVGDDGDRDGIPNVILEAMAMGLPVISTQHSGIPEAVGHEETGLLVPPGNSAALADAIAAVLSDPAAGHAMGAKGRAVVERQFDAAHNVRELYDRFSRERSAS